MAVTLRPICREDEPFLLEVYAGARRDELARVPWDETQKRAFLTFQFTAQHQHYQDHFAEAEYCVVLDGGLPVGRLYVDRRVDEIRILDVAVLPEYQGQGIGRTLIQTLLREAEAAGKPVRLYVENFQQRSQAVFRQLGFEPKEDHGLSLLMEWQPG